MVNWKEINRDLTGVYIVLALVAGLATAKYVPWKTPRVQQASAQQAPARAKEDLFLKVMQENPSEFFLPVGPFALTPRAFSLLEHYTSEMHAYREEARGENIQRSSPELIPLPGMRELADRAAKVEGDSILSESHIETAYRRYVDEVFTRQKK